MYASPGCLPHLLPPKAYWCPDYYERELKDLLDSAWHLVGTTGDLRRPGDYLTFNLLGREIQVRNFDGQLVALSNVCAHRHCLIRPHGKGHSSSMKCQYHGWEYASSGRTRIIPEPHNFVPFPAGKPCLSSYRLEVAGGLIFLCLAGEAPTLKEHLGSMAGLCAERFGQNWTLSAQWDFEYPANWKIPVENSLEAYHIPSVHPKTFKKDPGEQRSFHLLEEGHTAFTTGLPFAETRLDLAFQRGESWIFRRLGGRPRGTYAQHHIFPNLLFSFTDTMSFCQSVIPTGPTSCRSVVRQFGFSPPESSGAQQLLGRVWNGLKGLVTGRILSEDLLLFQSIQKGMEASEEAGMLGRCEERIHAFQLFLRSRQGFASREVRTDS